jgi:hypothetical protein
MFSSQLCLSLHAMGITESLSQDTPDYSLLEQSPITPYSDSSNSSSSSSSSNSSSSSTISASSSSSYPPSIWCPLWVLLLRALSVQQEAAGRHRFASRSLTLCGDVLLCHGYSDLAR